MEFDASVSCAVEIAIRVCDADAALRFYAGTLGLQPAFELAVHENGRRYWGLRCGGALIKLIHEDNSMLQPDGGTRYGYSHLSLHVADAHALVTACANAGYRTEDPVAFPASIGRPGRFANVWDPDGNRIELIEGWQWSAARLEP